MTPRGSPGYYTIIHSSHIMEMAITSLRICRMGKNMIQPLK